MGVCVPPAGGYSGRNTLEEKKQKNLDNLFRSNQNKKISLNKIFFSFTQRKLRTK